MSVRVELGDLQAEIARFGTHPLLVTQSSDGPPHVSSVVATLDGDDVTMGVGRTTYRNAVEHPAVTLVWTAASDTDYCLIVDAEARAGRDNTLVARPISAVLHRLATADTGRDP